MVVSIRAVDIPIPCSSEPCHADLDPIGAADGAGSRRTTNSADPATTSNALDLVSDVIVPRLPRCWLLGSRPTVKIIPRPGMARCSIARMWTPPRDAPARRAVRAGETGVMPAIPRSAAARPRSRCGPEPCCDPVARGRSRLLCVLARVSPGPTYTGRRSQRGRHQGTRDGRTQPWTRSACLTATDPYPAHPVLCA